MDPLLEVQRKSRSMDRDAYRESLDRSVKAVTESTPYRLADLILNGEDVDLPMAESLIPTVTLQAKLKQGKTPGLADILDIPNPLKAMGPIAFGLKEFRNGARMGKTLRNIEKAKNPVLKMYHRTNVENVPSIMREGLLASPPDKGVHTFNEDAPDMVWLSRTPEAPVLTDKANRYPRTVGHIEITMPKSEYVNRKQIIDNRWHELPNEDRDFVPIPWGGKFGSVTIFPDDVGPSHLRDVTSEYWKKQEYPWKLRLMAGDAGVDTHGSVGELEDRLRSQNIKTRRDAVKSGKFKGWKPGELPVLKRNKYLGTAYTNYSPAEQKRRASVYDKFYGTDQESHPYIMRKLYYEASPKDKQSVMKYLRQDYERDWISDEDWFDYDDNMKKEYRDFLRNLKNGKELKNYFPLTGFED